MMQLRIRDQKADGTVIPLTELIAAVFRIDPVLMQGEWTIEQGAYGHGFKVCELEDRLEDNKTLNINMTELQAILADESECFFNAKFVRADGQLCLGLNDSTFLFVISADTGLIKSLSAQFARTEMVR